MVQRPRPILLQFRPCSGLVLISIAEDTRILEVDPKTKLSRSSGKLLNYAALRNR